MTKRSSIFVVAIALGVAACSSSSTEGQPAPAGDGAPVAPGPAAGGALTDTSPPSTSPPPSDAGDTGSNASWDPTKCSATPAGTTVGTTVGSQIPNLVLKDCDGNDYALDRVACGATATWLFVAHGWCPYCQSATRKAESILAGYAGKNVAAINVLVKNAASEPPTMTDCKAWRDTFKLTNVIALYDPTGVTLPLFDAGSSALGVYLDDERIIRSKTIHTDDTTAITNGIDGALAP